MGSMDVEVRTEEVALLVERARKCVGAGDVDNARFHLSKATDVLKQLQGVKTETLDRVRSAYEGLCQQVRVIARRPRCGKLRRHEGHRGTSPRRGRERVRGEG